MLAVALWGGEAFGSICWARRGRGAKSSYWGVESNRMSTRKFAWLTAIAAALVVQATAWGQAGSARLGTYEQDGQEVFALSLVSPVAADPTQKNDVVILVDTSASQTGRYRADAAAAVQSLLATLSPDDRVELMAIDMKAMPMSAGFVAPQGPQMQAAMA